MDGFQRERLVDRCICLRRIIRVSGWDGLSDAIRTTMSELRLPVCDLKMDGIFTTQIEKDRWLFLNTTNKPSVIKFGLSGKNDAPVKAETITVVDLGKTLK